MSQGFIVVLQLSSVDEDTVDFLKRFHNVETAEEAIKLHVEHGMRAIHEDNEVIEVREY